MSRYPNILGSFALWRDARRRKVLGKILASLETAKPDELCRIHTQVAEIYLKIGYPQLAYEHLHTAEAAFRNCPTTHSADIVELKLLWAELFRSNRKFEKAKEYAGEGLRFSRLHRDAQLTERAEALINQIISEEKRLQGGRNERRRIS